MPPRSSWKGYLRLSLVSVPVQAFTASVSGGGEIHLNQLHAECHSRIRYKKVCPIHGEVSSEEIVSGFEHSKGNYVVIDTGELEKLRTENDRAINIDTFIRPEDVDPMYYDGRTYYLIPDGPVGQKPYAVLYQGMVEQQRYAIAQAVFSGKEQLMLIRPVDGLLTAIMLSFENQVRKPSAFTEEFVKPEVTKEELRLAETLINASTAEDFNLAKYEDIYTKKLSALIEAKVEGRDLVAPPAEEERSVINLMDALRQSVAKAQETAPKKTAARPPKKMAASRRKKAAPLKKKSS